MASKGLSEDMTVELLSRLPAKSLMQFKSFGKSFSDFVTRPRFITKHFQFSNEKPHLLIFHYQSNLSSSLRISLFSDELPWTTDDLGLQIREILQNSPDLGPIPRDFGLTFIAPPCIYMPLGTKLSQPAVDMGLTFPESSQLPSDACLPFQTVSQPLVPKISQPFVDLELPFPDKYVLEIVPYGPCNGIFCLYGSYLDSPDQFILWNPATKEVKVLPLPHHLPSGVEMCTYGFGLDPGTNDYKVVSILMVMEQQLASKVSGETQIPLVEVYSLSTDSWRKIDVAIPAFDFSYSIFNSYLNGVYHWLAKSSNVIVCFDMSNEVFYTMKLPLVIEDYTNEHLVNCNIAVFNDSIAYVKEYLSQLLFDRIEIWVMNKHGAEESWTKRYSIGPLLGLGKFWGFWKDGEILTKVEDKGTLISYKLETQQPVQEFPVPSGSVLFAAFSYAESIFPISVLAEEQA